MNLLTNFFKLYIAFVDYFFQVLINLFDFISYLFLYAFTQFSLQFSESLDKLALPAMFQHDTVVSFNLNPYLSRSFFISLN